MENIAIIGASADRNKFGNKCVRAYKSKDYAVFPVNPKENKIEGLNCFPNITDIPETIDIVSLYILPEITEDIINDIISVKPKLIYFNPGTEDEEIINKLQKAGIEVKKECSIIAIGIHPDEL